MNTPPPRTPGESGGIPDSAGGAPGLPGIIGDREDAGTRTPDLFRHAAPCLAQFPPDAPQLIGVSGGRDSIALLHALVARGYGRLIVCHLDHGLRAESAGDAQFVAEGAERLGLASRIEHADIRALAKRRHESLETAGRHARAAFFARIAARESAVSAAFLAHHADDQVETFLFNLCRGAGSTGLGGMRAVSRFGDASSSLWIARPLLGIWREEINAYIAHHRLEFREDASNADPAFARNRLRHTAIPALSAALGRDVRRAIWRAAEILRDEDEFLSALPAAIPPAGELPTPQLREQPIALQRRLLHAWLAAAGIPSIGFDEIEAVRALLETRTAKANLPAGHHARRRAGRLFLERPAEPS